MDEQKKTAEPLTLEENTELAKSLVKMVTIAEDIAAQFPLERLQATQKKMRDHASTMGTMSVIVGPDALTKADSVKATNRVFDGLVELIAARSAQRTLAYKQAASAGEMNKLRSVLGM